LRASSSGAVGPNEGSRSEPSFAGNVHFREVVIDCADPRALARFWAAATGYDLQSDDDDWASILGEEDRAIRIGFQKVPEGKVVKNRVHVDLGSPDEEAEATRIEALGATRLWVSDDPEDPFVVLGDPEGNEFCVVRVTPTS
jgi:predicted enzyme related to lactoylglutathione lyase